MTDRSRIESYWEDPKTVSLIDKNLRRLETDFVLSHLSSNDDLADIGCGDGESTLEYARKVRTCMALEQSNTLRDKTATRLAEAGVQNVTLIPGNALDLSEYRGRFTVAVTQRVIINFMSWEEQCQAIENIHSILKTGGLYLMIENTFEGFEALNEVRRSVGLPNIPLHDWHNYFLHYDRFLEFIQRRFVIERQHTFNLYYLLTRVFTNMFATFEGCGISASKDPLFEVADAAARRLYEVFGERLSFKLDKGQSFGPIQGFALRKLS
jgi:ubiquinone/menaquinone biosynthesis C-methylase UbiE